MSQPAFTNLIVTYNSEPDVSRLLDDLRQHAPRGTTIVVDNASTDATAALVQVRHPEVQLVSNSRNVGYARAVNQGFALSSTAYVFLINPDIRIESPRVLVGLSEFLDRHPHAAVAAPLQFKIDGEQRHLNFTWSYWTPAAFGVYMSHLSRRGAPAVDPIRVTFLNAGCLFMRRSAFEAVGKLNEKYFLYGEEPDLFLKFKRYGYECWLLPGVSVIHDRERSLATVPFLRRLRYKLQGAWNISDALITGIASIALDRLKGTRPG